MSKTIEYKYSGTVSYEQFKEERNNLVRMFGGTVEECSSDMIYSAMAMDKIPPSQFEQCYDSYKIEEIVRLPEEMNMTVPFRWIHTPYWNYSAEEVKTVWAEVSKYPEAKKIAKSIYMELEASVKNNDSWNIKLMK